MRLDLNPWCSTGMAHGIQLGCLLPIIPTRLDWDVLGVDQLIDSYLLLAVFLCYTLRHLHFLAVQASGARNK